MHSVYCKSKYPVVLPCFIRTQDFHMRYLYKP